MAFAKHFMCICLLLAAGILCKEAGATRNEPEASNNGADSPLLGDIREARHEAQESISQVSVFHRSTTASGEKRRRRFAALQGCNLVLL
jgi:hypothetical protein